MRPNKLRELLKSNKPTLSTHIHTTWPSIVEAIGHTGLYDYVEFVGEYGPFDLHDLDNLARAGDIYNMSMQLKVDQEPRGFLAQRAIGSGFHSILFADCRSAADVQECVRIVRAETPEDKGTYGVATRRFTYMGYGGTKEYVQALRDIVVAIMIEKPGTVDTLEEVLSVKGVDMVQWGGSDYSMGIATAGERYSPELRVVERRVFETAIKMGVPPPKHAGRGLDALCCARDVSVSRREPDPAHTVCQLRRHRPERARLAGRRGRGFSASAGARGLRPRADPRRADRHGAAGHEVPHGRRARLSHRSRPAGLARLHLDVPARVLDAPDRQHVVPVGLRRQHRGLDGARSLHDLLSALRDRRGPAAGRLQPGLGHPDGRRLGRHQRRHGRLSDPVPARTRLRAGLSRVLRHLDRAAGVDDAALLGGHPVPERSVRAVRRGAGRRR